MSISKDKKGWTNSYFPGQHFKSRTLARTGGATASGSGRVAKSLTDVQAAVVEKHVAKSKAGKGNGKKSSLPKVKFTQDFDRDGNALITFIKDGLPVTVDYTHPNFAGISSALKDGQDPSDLLDASAADAGHLENFVSTDERLGVDDSGEADDEVAETPSVTFEGEKVHDKLLDTILRYSRQGKPTGGLVKFLENLQSNPSPRSRSELFTWVVAKDLTITEDGHFIAYKSLKHDSTSVHAGHAFVNGVEHHGYIPNPKGAIVTMPRGEVDDNASYDCSHGLHVGDHGYTMGFGVTRVTVKVNPADVVSVPSYEDARKLRCCRYEVLDGVEKTVEADLDVYEPQGTSEFLSDLEEALPPTFFSRLVKRIRRKG